MEPLDSTSRYRVYAKNEKNEYTLRGEYSSLNDAMVLVKELKQKDGVKNIAVTLCKKFMVYDDSAQIET